MNFSNLDTFPTTGKHKDQLDWEKECDDIFTFDIECSNGWVKDGKVVCYEAGHDEQYWNKLMPVSLCYHWQFSKNDEIITGRKLGDFIDILRQIPSDTHVIIYVHNLEYEFAFLNNYLKWSVVFARENHKPMKAVPADYPNIEFRCSYTLTRLSLDAWGKSLGCPKSHALDYTVLRTPLTRLTQDETDYCLRDCEVVYKGIEKYREKYSHVFKIPLTQTGEIRKVVKKRMMANKSLYYQLIKLIPANAYMYKIMKTTFQGGYTHANMMYAGYTVKDGVSFDFASSYPAVMCSEKYPMSPFIPEIFEENKIDDYAYLIRIKYKDITSRTINHYISLSKCLSIENPVIDNGRVISADSLEMWITEQDYLTIKNTYQYKAHIEECYRSKKEYLPYELVSYVLELYANKTRYKNVPGMEEIYQQAKQFINSLFGMCVTDLLFDDVDYDGFVWTKTEKTLSDVDAYILDLREHNKGRTFLAYQWGIWISAYARRNLWKCLMRYDMDIVYCDTDSLKIVVRNGKLPDFSWQNEDMKNKLEAMCKTYGLDVELTRPKDPKGIERPLGFFLREDDWSEFRTLGAKRYVARYKSDNKLHLTVSGINKDAVACLNDDINNFNFETVFDKDADGVKKNLRTYTHDQPDIIWNVGQYDEYLSTEKEGIVIRPTSYSMSIADEYDFLLKNVKDYLTCI